MSKRRRGISDTRLTIALAMMGIVIIGLGMGFTAELSNARSLNGSQQNAQIQSLEAQIQRLDSGNSIQTAQAQVQAPNSSSAYKLTLVITSNDAWNSTTAAPRFWVLTSGGLVSSADISLPAHSLIELTVIDFDTATPIPTQYAQVSGTVGNTMAMVNITATSQNPTNASNVEVVSSLDPSAQVGHTFTIPELGINIPSAPNSVEVADFYTNQAGTFVWHCEDPCGFGPSGWLGPMNTMGWMGGSINVS